MESADGREEESVKNNLLLADFQTMKTETHDKELAIDAVKKLTKYKTMVSAITEDMRLRQ